MCRCYKRLGLLQFLLSLSCYSLWAQALPEISHRPIDANAIDNWAQVAAPLISDDGNYVCYTVAAGKKVQVILACTKTNWSLAMDNIRSAQFTANSKQIVYGRQDTVFVLNLKTAKRLFFNHVKQFKLVSAGNKSWLLYQLKDQPDQLNACELASNKTRVTTLKHSNILELEITHTGYVLLATSDLEGAAVEWLDLKKNLLKTVWMSGNSDQSVDGIVVDENGQLCFRVIGKNPNAASDVWYAKPGQDAVKLDPLQKKLAISGFYVANSPLKFGASQNLFVRLGRVQPITVKPLPLSLDVWNYKDSVLQSLQLAEAHINRSYLAAFNLASRQLILLEDSNRSVAMLGKQFVLTDIYPGRYRLNEAYWNASARHRYEVLNLQNGQPQSATNEIIRSRNNVQLSPSGKWLIYYDAGEGDYFTCETVTARVHNVTGGCNSGWLLDNDGEGIQSPSRIIWAPDESCLYIYDDFDIWKIDPSGVNAPVNITNGFGRRNHIRFQLLDEKRPVVTYNKHQVYIFNTFNKDDKLAGFYIGDPDAASDPKKLSEGPYLYEHSNPTHGNNEPLIKSANAEQYIVCRETAEHGRNLFVTNDLVHFRSISNVHPEKNYNWLTAQLIRWKTLAGDNATGILYKPADFDPAKKYPVIFNYYEQRSDGLNEFLKPEYTSAEINIPWFVSRGYIVVIPDIPHILTKEPGVAALNAVVSAAKYLEKFAWVDSTHMALEGHSFGGYETNYIVTHTNLFAAACSVSGISDLTSFFGSDSRGGYPMFWAERGQGRLGVTPWQDPDLYQRNSPIRFVSKINTPILLVNNKDDYVAPFEQGVELFTSLRRMKKRAWLLQYDGQGHTLYGLAAKDFTIRLTQFFNYYLKGAAEPMWMASGIPSKQKGQESGLGLINGKTISSK